MTATALDTNPDVTAAAAPAWAKINLTLEVIRRRDDGYHELRSLVCSVDLRDHLRCRQTEQAGIELACADPTLAGPENLVFRAAEELARHAALEPALHVALHKRIPAGAGLGGGSSDAATALTLCNRLWGLDLGRAELAGIGARVGSDVPLFFYLPSAVMTGRGVEVEPVDLRWSGWALLVLTGWHVPTADVYRAWRPTDVAGLPGGTDSEIVRATTAEELSPLLENHLEPAVFRVSPAVARTAELLKRLGGGPMRVTGAGSTFYQLFDDRDAACRRARKIEELNIGITTAVVAAPAGESALGAQGGSNGNH